MDKQELIRCFQDTLFISNRVLQRKTGQAVDSSRVYHEGFVSSAELGDVCGTVHVEQNTTFAAAKKYRKEGRVAVLNFANPVNPGGGVENGAVAQEECLCRSSNLYPCLVSEDVFAEYYQYHRDKGGMFFSDRLIYTENVTVFKTDEAVPEMMPQNEWFDVDVITCAAPYLGSLRHVNYTVLKSQFMNRIRNIFESAVDHQAEILILGAFGCGAFKNPPLIVASAFETVIRQYEYDRAFKKIVFAVKASEHAADRNLEIFSSQFEGYAYRKQINMPPVREDWMFRKVPKLEGLDRLELNSEFKKYQEQNPYFGRQFSVIGDSISTLDGYNPRGYALFYTDENCQRTDVFDSQDTWWGKIIDFFGGELLVNNSWSGSRVTRLPGRSELFPSACSFERTSALHMGAVMPDVILIYMGMNDWGNGVKLSAGRSPEGEDRSDESVFSFAYGEMIRKVRQRYPGAEIWCGTLNRTRMSEQPDFVFPPRIEGIDLVDYNRVIRKIAEQNRCRILDFEKYDRPYDSVDGSNPTHAGMDTLAMMAIAEMGGAAAAQVISQHIEAFGGRDVSWLKQDQQLSFCDNEICMDRFDVIHHIESGYGTKMVQAIDRMRNRLVTIKAYEKTALKPEQLNNVRHMYQVLKDCSGSGILPCVSEVLDGDLNLMIVMDYVEGVTLKDSVRRRGPMPAEQVLEMAEQVCFILKNLHSEDPPRLHGEVIPSNIYFTEDHKIMLMMNNRKLLAGGTDDLQLNAMGYKAPEHITSGICSVRSDIFMLGMTMFHAVTGIDPVKDVYSVKPIRKLDKKYPKGLEKIICKCTEPDPEKRYQNINELLYAMDLEKEKKKGLLNRIFWRGDPEIFD